MALSVVETVTAAAATYNLTDLETVKLELSIGDPDTSNDTWLAKAITQTSKAAQKYCKQPLVVEAVLNTIDIEQDPYPYQTPGGVRPLQLSRFPLISVGTVLQTIAINTTQTLTLGTDYRIDAKTGQLIRLNPFTGVATDWEALPLLVPFVAGLGAETTEGKTIPANPGPYTLTVNNAAQFSIDQGVTYSSSGIALTAITSGNPAQGQYLVTAVLANGAMTVTYTFAAADADLGVNITYGYNVIEDDVQAAVLQLVTSRFRGRARDPMLMERTERGADRTERYWVPDPSKVDGALPPEVQGLLDQYRVPSVA